MQNICAHYINLLQACLLAEASVVSQKSLHCFPFDTLCLGGERSKIDKKREQKKT